MRLATPGTPHLTYCTNIHAGETWQDIRASLEGPVLAVKRAVQPTRPFGVGLRLSAQAAEELAREGEMDQLCAFLAAHDLYVFTINGFPYGQFHGTRVKEQVYLPDWSDDRRLVYTDRLARHLAALLPEGTLGSISTVPCGQEALTPSNVTSIGSQTARVARGRGEAPRALPEEGGRERPPLIVGAFSERLLAHAATLHGIRETTGKTIVLALEPEPCCFLETARDTIAFFQQHLFSRDAIAWFSKLTGLAPSASEDSLRRHLGACLDTCHMAVMHEDPTSALRSLSAAGIRIAKIQLSSALEVPCLSHAEVRTALAAMANDVYLHQVVAGDGSGLTHYLDLPLALASPTKHALARVHFHVPLYLADFGLFRGTQAFLREVLAEVRAEAIAPHLEVETYTFDVLPEEYRRRGVVSAVADELLWVLEQLH
ncbi:MAG: sugar phosphate isomerase [Deltaproteobacteria bacterium]|nr:sugar phosphate isomerase [Deltaproteobacteria bacterium]